MTPHDGHQGDRGDLDLSTTFERDDWPERLRAAVAETLAARQARRDLRTQLAERRAVGLERRHAEKLGRRCVDQVSDVSSRTGTPADAERPCTPSVPATTADELGERTGTPVHDSTSPYRYGEVAQGPTTESQVATPSKGAASDAQAATLARLRRAGQGGWRPLRATDA